MYSLVKAAVAGTIAAEAAAANGALMPVDDASVGNRIFRAFAPLHAGQGI
jgi:hypothetical protein